MIERVKGFIKNLVAEKFFGEVTFTFKEGKIVSIKKTESVRL